MRGWLVRGGILLALAPITASADTPPSVIFATPGMNGSAITRFTLRFSEPMVPLGQAGSRRAPIAMTCKVDGEGRWVDPATYVWEFDKPLPGDTVCTAELRDGLETLDGDTVGGTQRFKIDSGGPAPTAILTGSSGDGIEEDQAFVVAVNGPVDRASIAANVYCTVDGIGERIPVDLLPAETAGRVIGEMGARWTAERFLETAGLPSPLPAAAGERSAALANVVALKCRRNLPSGRDMALVWGKNVRTPSGRLAGKDHRFDYEVRRAFTARVVCARVNATSGCNPLEPIRVRFTADVPRSQALSLRLDVGGRAIAPVDQGRETTLSEISFKPPLPPATTARLVVPGDIRDESGRPLANARRFPLDVAVSDTPPLVKFAAPFGILEAEEGGVLPVTLRGVEPALQQKLAGISGGTARIEADDGAIAGWIRRVARAQEDDIRNEGSEESPRMVNHTGTSSLLGNYARVDEMQLALPGKGKDFEVVGIPLGNPGFYVVELASPELGRVLLGRPATRYVSAAALVTDMTVHFKWGRAGSLAWVTSLSEGKAVAGAVVRVTDSCTGRQLAAGITDKHGRLPIGDGLPPPTSRSDCDGLGGDSPPLMVSARKRGDFSFTLTNWGEGIGPEDFELPYGWAEAEPVFHSILDRTLLRVGETVHMKHVYRMPTANGFRSGGALDGTLELSHRGSETRYELPLSVDKRGIGESEWTPPKGAPSGDYDIRVLRGPPRPANAEESDVPDERQAIFTAQSIRVDEYRLPTMRASVSGPKTPSVRPRQLPLDLYVGYLSGGGAAGAAVKLRTAWDSFTEAPDGWEGWTFGGGRVAEGVVPLDEDRRDSGTTRLPDTTTLPLALDAGGALRSPLEMPTLDEDARLTVEMDYQDANGETLTATTRIPIHASAVRLGIKSDGWVQRSGDMRLKVVALSLDRRPIRGQPVSVALYTREILSARRRLIGGFYAYDNVAETRRIAASCAGGTDAQGLLSCRLDPGVSGEVIAVATTRDEIGNEARAVTSLYLAGEDDWWFGGDNGDRMDIIPDERSYRSGDTAHLQVRMPFREATALVTIEREGVLSSFVTELSGKNPVVRVPLAGGYAPDVYVSVMAVRGRVSSWRVWLAELAKEWNIPLLKRVANPTALVDLAKPSYRIGIIRLKVGWEAHALKVAVRADKERYQVRDIAHAAVQVLGPDGRPPASAEIAFAAVDEALLVLSPNESWKLLDAMMGERPLSVLTATAQMQVVGKRHYGRKAVAAGGGGGGDLTELIRTDFKPVLLWRGRVVLDADGRAVVEVPLADSLSAYRLVAIATSGSALFGTGFAQVRTVQDLTLYSGLPPLVRSGDEFGATFTLRNGSDRGMEVTASASVEGGAAIGGPQTVTVPAGGAVPVTWRLTAPDNVDLLRWTVTARSADGRAVDRLKVDEQVVPAIPVETWAGTFLRVDGAPFSLIPPPGALPGRGSIEVALSDSPSPSLAGVRAYMRAYPYTCFEQRLSQAVALDDGAAWARQMQELPGYVSRDGLLRYWPAQSMPGSIALTAYALSVTAEAGLEWPRDQRQRLIDAMKGVVDGRIVDDGDGPSDRRLLRLQALAALARHGAATPEMLAQVAVPIADMPTATLADWLTTLDRTKASVAQRRAAEAALRARIVWEGRRLDIVDKARAPWWMMVSSDEMALKALLAVIGRRGWEADAPRMMIGAALRQQRGHWDTTPANAWGTIAARRFDTVYPRAAGGITTGRVGGAVLTRRWAGTASGRAPARPEVMVFALPARPSPLLLSHDRAPQPWATISVKAAVPLTAPAFAGYRISRQVSFVERKQTGRLSAGDVLKVTIDIDAPVDRTWVVVSDPVPAGASVISGSGGQSALLAAQASGGGRWPSYIERTHEAWRAYFEWLPRGRTSVEYVVRVNGSGRFQLPPTRVEAMYSPEIHAALPNKRLEVAP